MNIETRKLRSDLMKVLDAARSQANLFAPVGLEEAIQGVEAVLGHPMGCAIYREPTPAKPDATAPAPDREKDVQVDVHIEIRAKEGVIYCDTHIDRLLLFMAPTGPVDALINCMGPAAIGCSDEWGRRAKLTASAQKPLVEG